jgi:hypothetical protein
MPETQVGRPVLRDREINAPKPVSVKDRRGWFEPSRGSHSYKVSDQGSVKSSEEGAEFHEESPWGRLFDRCEEVTEHLAAIA